MQKYYLNKLKNLENKITLDEKETFKLLTYCTLPDSRIKADLCTNNGFTDTFYFDTIEELEQFKQEEKITTSIEGLDIDKI